MQAPAGAVQHADRDRSVHACNISGDRPRYVPFGVRARRSSQFASRVRNWSRSSVSSESCFSTPSSFAAASSRTRRQGAPHRGRRECGRAPRERKSHRHGAPAQAQAVDRRRRILAISAGCARRLRQHADSLIVTQRVGADADEARQGSGAQPLRFGIVARSTDILPRNRFQGT